MRQNQYQHSHQSTDISARLAANKPLGFLRDSVFGGIDGTVTTFAIVSGVMGAGLSHNVILVLGIANLLADGFSMAAGNYTATRADLERIDYLIDVEKQHISRYPEGEEEELRQILAGYGYRSENLETAVATIKTCPDLWIDLMLQGEYGVSSMRPGPIGAALATFVAFVVCGSIPLLPFLLRMDNAITVAGVATLLVFFLVGAAKTQSTNGSWWRSGIATLVTGALAAIIAFACGHFLAPLMA